VSTSTPPYVFMECCLTNLKYIGTLDVWNIQQKFIDTKKLVFNWVYLTFIFSGKNKYHIVAHSILGGCTFFCE
jgi:hypothetical protein